MTGITFQQMAAVALSEARRIEIVQKMLVEVGELTTPDKGQIHKQHAFEAIGRLIDVVVSDTVILDRLKQRAEKQKAAAAKASKATASDKSATTTTGGSAESASVPDDTG